MEQAENKKKVVGVGDRRWTDSEVDDGLLTELLRRLPLKSLFKFKCVSKRWFSVISDPSMRRLYLNLNMPRHTLVCQHTCPESCDISIKIESHPEAGLESVELKLGFSPKEAEELRIVAGDKGLLLSCELSLTRQAYYVSNPLTGQWTGLPDPPRITVSDYDIFLSTCVVMEPGSPYQPRGVGRANGDGSIYQPRGVGFVSGPGSNYKVIRIQDYEHDRLQLARFDSGKGLWRSSTVLLSQPVRKVYDRLVPGVLYKGALHWAVDSLSFDCGKIVVYDPALHDSEGDDYVCRVFDCPPPFGIYIYGEGVLGLSGGEIRYADFTLPDDEIESPLGPYARGKRILCVWLLKDYDSAEWCLEHKILESEMMEAFPLPYERLYVWDFDPVDKDTMYFCVTADFDPSSYKSLASYGILGRKMNLLCSHGVLPIASTPTRLNIFSHHRFLRLINGRHQLLLRPTISALPFALSPWPTPL